MADGLDLFVRAVALPVGGFILANGVDDLLVDLTYFFRGLYRHRERRVELEDLQAVEEKRVAIMVPAWQEADVIEQMLELNLRSIDYPADKYDIFVGTYANDLDTQERVDAVASRAHNIHRVVTPHDGPTNKADNLNWIFQGIALHEERRGVRFDILLMHDAEDIIHPLALRLYNANIPEYDFIQTPVFPLPTPPWKFVAGTYIDEFTEYHLKDMLVRGDVGGLVPSAGVGSAFARDSFEEIALANDQQAFNPESLTEDYEIGMKFRLADKNARFLTQAVPRVKLVERGIFRKRQVQVVVDEYIATREYFPDSFRSSVRQRSRWVLGIAIQTWAQIGWSGPLPVVYCLWRDRKSLLTSYIGPLAYAIMAYAVARMTMGWFSGQPWQIRSLFPPGSVLWYIVLLNTVLLGWRVLMKFITVEEVYGPVQALMAVPRFFVSNVISLIATTRALWQFLIHKITGDPIPWLKTSHAFPRVEMLRSYRRWLGELLVDREDLSEEELDEALDLHNLSGLPLGETCVSMGLVDAPEVASALAQQFDLPLHSPNPYAIPLSLLRRLPEAEAIELDVLPVAERVDGTVEVAVSRPARGPLTERLEARLGARVAWVFSDGNLLRRARERAYRRLLAHARTQGLPIGQRLIEAGLIDQEALDRGLREQSQTEEPLGELLVRMGLVSPDDLSTILSAQLKESFRALDSRDVHPAAMQLLGYGFASLHGLVPLRADHPGGPMILAGAGPLHPRVRAVCEARLGVPFQPVLASAVQVRLALAVAARRAWPSGIARGVSGIDGHLIAAIERERALPPDLMARARKGGHDPVDDLLAAHALTPLEAARLRGVALGIPVVERPAHLPDQPMGWLPPGWAIKADVRLLDSVAGTLIVAAPRPTALLARRFASLFPDAAIAWAVLPAAEVSSVDAAAGK